VKTAKEKGPNENGVIETLPPNGEKSILQIEYLQNNFARFADFISK
jgi:hypothetical protein